MALRAPKPGRTKAKSDRLLDGTAIATTAWEDVSETMPNHDGFGKPEPEAGFDQRVGTDREICQPRRCVLTEHRAAASL